MANETQLVDQHVGELLSGFVDGELTQQDNQFVNVHIQSCDNCQKTYSELLEMQTGIREIKTDGAQCMYIAHRSEASPLIYRRF